MSKFGIQIPSTIIELCEHICCGHNHANKQAQVSFCQRGKGEHQFGVRERFLKKGKKKKLTNIRLRVSQKW